mmetsp:Transcript_41446/g.133714  ORF Transcript_41446/g.133714 Transcript_41446/m.133714 type:complete len:274 (+) Transcript_41446:173-994(+)
MRRCARKRRARVPLIAGPLIPGLEFPGCGPSCCGVPGGAPSRARYLGAHGPGLSAATSTAPVLPSGRCRSRRWRRSRASRAGPSTTGAHSSEPPRPRMARAWTLTKEPQTPKPRRLWQTPASSSASTPLTPAPEAPPRLRPRPRPLRRRGPTKEPLRGWPESRPQTHHRKDNLPEWAPPATTAELLPQRGGEARAAARRCCCRRCRCGPPRGPGRRSGLRRGRSPAMTRANAQAFLTEMPLGRGCCAARPRLPRHRGEASGASTPGASEEASG